MDINERLKEIEKEENRLLKEKRQILAEQAQKPLLERLDYFKSVRDKMVNDLRSEFPNFILPLMAQSDNIKSIGFTAYTPYFNDGDTCGYRVHTSYLYVNGDEDPQLSDDDRKLVNEISKVLRQIPDEIYRDVFGDHVLVHVNIDGTVTTEEYEHE